MRIDLRIDRIVLDGVTFGPEDRARLHDAVRAQLVERLVRDGRLGADGLDALRANHGAATLRGILRQGGSDQSTSVSGSHRAADAGALAPRGADVLRMPGSATPGQWGRGIAQAVHGAMTSGGATSSTRGSGDGRTDGGAR